jgi:chemotaxis signal transduction protein
VKDDRAEMLPLEALLSERDEPETSGLAVLVFEAGGATRGVEAASVEAVVRLAPIAPLPSAPPA